MTNQQQLTELQEALAKAAECLLGKPVNDSYGYIDFEEEFVINENEERADKAASLYVTYSIPLGELSDGEKAYYITKYIVLGDGSTDTFAAHLVPQYINEAAELLISDLTSKSNELIEATGELQAPIISVGDKVKDSDGRIWTVVGFAGSYVGSPMVKLEAPRPDSPTGQERLLLSYVGATPVERGEVEQQIVYPSSEYTPVK